MGKKKDRVKAAAIDLMVAITELDEALDRADMNKYLSYDVYSGVSNTYNRILDKIYEKEIRKNLKNYKN